MVNEGECSSDQKFFVCGEGSSPLSVDLLKKVDNRVSYKSRTITF